MDTTHLAQDYLRFLETAGQASLESELESPSKLLIAADTHRGKRIEIAYAPFDFINRNARIVIVGITPGRQQMRNAIQECRRQLRAGCATAAALEAAKNHASFSGPMRQNLVDMLDAIGVARLLGLASTASLWAGDANLVHFTSALRYPVFVDGANYSGTPAMTGVPMLWDLLETALVEEMRTLPDALWVPLGPKVGEALTVMAEKTGVPREQILDGLPHPSGASAERVAYFLGRKPRALLSAKTNADRLDAAKSDLTAKMKKLGA